MTIPRVIEIPPRLEPVTVDTFGDPRRLAVVQPARPAAS
jgi:hypothetical protein